MNQKENKNVKIKRLGKIITGIESKTKKRFSKLQSASLADHRSGKSIIARMGRKRLFHGYLSLYRYATCGDIPLLSVAVIAAVLSGVCVPAMATSFGKLANAMIMLHVIQTRHATPNATFCTKVIDHREFNWQNPARLKHQELENFCSWFTISAVSYTILNAIAFVCWSIPAEKQTVRWATEYVKGLLKKDMEWFDVNFGIEATSDVIENICRVRQGIGIQVLFAVSIFSSFFFSAACVLWRTYLSWLFITVTIMVIPFIAYFQNAIDSKTTSQSDSFTESVLPVVTFAEQVFERIQSVILHNGQKKELHYFKQMQNQSIKMQISNLLFSSLLDSFLTLGLHTYFAMVLWQSLQQVWEYRSCHQIHGFDKFDAEVLFTVFGCVMLGMLNVWLLRSIYDQFEKASLSGAKLAQIIDSELPEFDGDNNNRGIILDTIKGKVEFEDVGFAYPSKKKVPVLKGITLSIEPGWKVGFVGVLGTGLSTLIKLFLLNYTPDWGFIRLDDIDIRQLDRKWYLSSLGFLSHDPVIFDESIEDNIRMGNTTATQEEIENACKMAEVHELILQLQNGYGTMAGENGELISPQLRIQIALARVLLQKPKILVFDEPTITLDWQSSCIIEKILDKVSKNTTTLLIPHRFQSVRNADMIYVVSNGIVVEQGSHEELMSKEGAFYQSMISQSDITPSKRLELAKINKIFLGKQLLPPFSFSKSWTTTGFPGTMGIATTQISMESKLATPTFGENSFEGEATLGKHYRKIAQTPVPTPQKPFTIDRIRSDTYWKKCIEREDKYYLNPSSAYTPISEDDVFCCWSILRLTFSSLPCIVIGILASCALGLLTPCYGYIIGKTIEILGYSNQHESIREGKKLAIFFLALGGISFVVVFVKTFVLEYGSRLCFRSVQKRLFASILRQEYGWFELPENNTHSLQKRLSKDCAGIKYIVKTFYDTIAHYAAVVCACTGLAIYLSPHLGSMCSFLVILAITSTLMDSVLLINIEGRRKDTIKLLRGLITELCNRRQAVRPLQLQPYFLNKLKSTIESAYVSRGHILLIYVRGFTYGISRGGGWILYSILMKIGSKYIVSDDVSFALVVTIAHLLVIEMMQVGVAISMVPTHKNAMVCGANILKIINRHPKICLDKGHAQDIHGDITFRNVHYWFEGLPNVRVLKEISFRIKEGMTVAMVGVAGSGKSICLQLILRLQDTPLGTVEIDGEDIRNMNCVQLRRQIALLNNDPLIVDRTVREVIAYGDNSRHVEINEIIEAAQKANIHMLISSLPQGYDTVVGSSRLTIGQKRRIILARIFLKNPKILLVEEPSTALDPESERKFLSSFERLREGRTCLILAHRVRTVEFADQILVFHEGRIQERGTHKQLMASGGVYRQIYESQSGKNQMFESTLVRKFDVDESAYYYGDFENSSSSNLRANRSTSLPNISSTSLKTSSDAVNPRTSVSIEDFADTIVNNISNGVVSFFSPFVQSSRNINN